MEPPPIALTLDAVLTSGWEAVLTSAKSRDCLAYARGFEEASAHASSEGDEVRAAALGMLAHVCTPMVWNNDDAALGPAAVVDALSTAQLDLIAGLASPVADPELSARINDILWLRRRDRHAAEIAVSAYLRSADHLFDPNEWSTGFARTERALNLAASLGKRNALYAEVLAAIEADLVRLEAGDPLYFAANLMKLQLEQRTGDATKGAARANALAEAAARDGDWWRANTLYELAGEWCTRGKDTDGARRARIAAAEAFVSVAAVRADAEPGAAAMNLQAGIEGYRRVGKEPARVDELLRVMADYQRRAAEQFASFGTTVDMTEHVKRAMDRVRGKASVLDALFALATASRSPSVAALRDSVRKEASQSPMRYLMTRNVVDPKTGRVVGRQDPPNNRADDGALETATFEHARNIQHLTAASLDPARQLILEEHPVRDRDLLPLVRSSPFVPPGREERFARGLAAGLRGDFMIAAALLLPQIESSLRFVVEQRGGQAYALGNDGVLDAHQLEHLLELEIVKTALGGDVVFDLRGLLIERFGSNLRHQEAHGLLDDEVYGSTTVAYFWWLTLRLCVVFAVEAARDFQRSSEPAAPATPEKEE